MILVSDGTVAKSAYADVKNYINQDHVHEDEPDIVEVIPGDRPAIIQVELVEDWGRERRVVQQN